MIASTGSIFTNHPTADRSRAAHSLSTLVIMLVLSALFGHPVIAAPVTTIDDAGNRITLVKPAQRIATFAPHATELVAASGADKHLIATDRFSDYPPAVRRLPHISDSIQIDIEQLIALRPDLLIVWKDGNSARQLEQLKRLNVPIFFSAPKKLADIPDSIERLGKLTGTDKEAIAQAVQLRQTLAQLAARYQQRATVRVFYQVWSRPLYTLNGQHIVSDAIRLCGGINIFERLRATAPAVTIESVVAANPDVILSADSPAANGSSLAMWQTYPAMRAVKYHQLIALDGELMNRAGPRMIAGVAALCEALEGVRGR